MAEIMNAKIANTNVYRLDVDFDIKSVESLTGRTAHIKFLTNTTYMDIILAKYGLINQ